MLSSGVRKGSVELTADGSVRGGIKAEHQSANQSVELTNRGIWSNLE